MAYRKVNDNSLASVADAIRSKGGTSDTLVFPDGFVTAISAIQTGGDGDGDAPIYTGDYTVTPDVVEQTLKTAQKKMTADVIIKKIPIWEVSNTSGGTTINIGKEV